MDVTATDLKRMETCVKDLRKGQYNFDGEKTLAFAQMFHWAGDFYKRMAEAVASTPDGSQTQPDGEKTTTKKRGTSRGRKS